jgi:hypothetical protein
MIFSKKQEQHQYLEVFLHPDYGKYRIYYRETNRLVQIE